MAIGSKYGAKIFKPKKLTNLIGYFFGEDQARYIVEIDKNNLPEVKKIFDENNIYHENIGFTQNEFFEIENEFKMSLNDLFKINNEWYNNY